MKLRKILTMGIAAVMAVSAMSISAFACDNPDDAVVSFLAADGESRIYLSQEDIDNGNNSVVGYGGITFEIEEKNDINEAGIMPLYDTTVDYDFTVSRSTKPSATLSVYNSTAIGSFDIAKYSQKFSTVLLQNKTNTKALMEVKPDAAFNRKVTFSLCAKEYTAGTLVDLEPSSKNTYAITTSGLPSWNLYCYVDNQLSTTARGTVSVTCYN